ncbi:LysR family transcriptional regulator [Sphingomonas profundi]|uniref:LysR family transcriptional regulator n=1 Tax=Alterirhizorhabdus profundi TaxID=2681549 RepID=UPI0012E8365A|nr:LysR family transcriptional regulator [Sphingomonas profundi]
MADFDLNLLRPLDALLRERSVTRAAHLLGISQPTMSGMLARLREQLQDPLLVRVGRAMELSPRAAGLADEVRQTMLRVGQLTTPLTPFDPAAARRHVRIMTSEFGLFLVLPDVFARAGTLAPGVTFETVPIDRPVRSVFAGEVDLCLTGDILQEVAGEMADAVRTQVLAEDRFVAVVDADHPLDGAATLDQLLAYPHVATQFPGSRWTVEDIGMSGLSERHPPRVRVASFLAIGRMVRGTDAVGIIPARLADLALAGGGLRTVTLPAGFRGVSIRLLWHARLDADPAQTWLRGLIVAACANLTRSA